MTGDPLPEALLRRLEERTHTAQAEADRLEEAITTLTAWQLLARLEATRQTLTELAEQAPPETTDLPDVYQQILTILTHAPDDLRTKDIRHALGLPDQPRHTEGTRAKLKRLVGRGLANEPRPGLFTPNR